MPPKHRVVWTWMPRDELHRIMVRTDGLTEQEFQTFTARLKSRRGQHGLEYRLREMLLDDSLETINEVEE